MPHHYYARGGRETRLGAACRLTRPLVSWSSKGGGRTSRSTFNPRARAAFGPSPGPIPPRAAPSMALCNPSSRPQNASPLKVSKPKSAVLGLRARLRLRSLDRDFVNLALWRQSPFPPRLRQLGYGHAPLKVETTIAEEPSDQKGYERRAPHHLPAGRGVGVATDVAPRSWR